LQVKAVFKQSVQVPSASKYLPSTQLVIADVATVTELATAAQVFGLVY